MTAEVQTYACPSCGSTEFRAEQIGWEIRTCELEAVDGAGVFDHYTGSAEFQSDDTAEAYYCAKCGDAA